jgi:hypothetical protein
MITSKSPRKVLRLAYALAQGALPAYDSRFSRHDFTNAQLFACLVLREHQRKSFRGIEALLRDSPQWCRDIGMRKVPDHNTLCRAFERFVRPELAWTMLDLMATLAQARGTLRQNRHGKPVALDSSLYESRHVSRHFEREQRGRAHRSAARTKKGRESGGKASTRAARGS